MRPLLDIVLWAGAEIQELGYISALDGFKNLVGKSRYYTIAEEYIFRAK